MKREGWLDMEEGGGDFFTFSLKGRMSGESSNEKYAHFIMGSEQQEFYTRSINHAALLIQGEMSTM